MCSEEFEDNDTFGAIDGESDCHASSGSSDEESGHPSGMGSDSESPSTGGKSRKRSKARVRRSLVAVWICVAYDGSILCRL